jgi:hypothetical protein
MLNPQSSSYCCRMPVYGTSYSGSLPSSLARSVPWKTLAARTRSNIDSSPRDTNRQRTYNQTIGSEFDMAGAEMGAIRLLEYSSAPRAARWCLRPCTLLARRSHIHVQTHWLGDGISTAVCMHFHMHDTQYFLHLGVSTKTLALVRSSSDRDPDANQSPTSIHPSHHI